MSLSLTGTRGAPGRPMGAELANPLGHLQRRFGGLFAAVAHVPAGARPRLLLAERGDHAEGGGHTGRERDVPDSGSGFARDVLEVWGLPPDHDTDAHDSRIPPAAREMVRRLRKLEGSGHPVDPWRAGAERGGPGALKRAGEEPLGDALVEPGRDDRKPERAGTPGAPAR